MDAIELFAGIGGLTLGMKQNDIETTCLVEKDPSCQEVLSRRMPNVPIWDSVETFGAKKYYELTGKRTVSLVLGGFPCQDVSIAGRRKGLAGERSGLWFEFRRIIDELKPEGVIIENVAGLLSSNGGRDLGTVVGNLAELGYWWAYRVLDAQYFGVPQRRRRVFIVASLRKGCPQEILFEPESSPWDTPPRRKTPKNVTQASVRLAQTSSNGWGIKVDGTIGTLDSTGGDAVMVAYGGSNTKGPIDVSTTLNAHGYGRLDFESETFICNTFNGYTGGADDNDAQGDHLVPCFTPWDSQPKRIHNPAAPAPTLASSDGGGGQRTPNFATDEGVRRLTPVECERLQGFPEIEKEFVFEICSDHQKSFVVAGNQNHKLQKLVGSAEKNGFQEYVKSAEKSSHISGLQTEKPAQKVVHIHCEERTVEVRSQKRLLLFASSAESKKKFHPFMQIEDFALLLVRINTILAQITHNGREGSQANGQLLILQRNGKTHVKLSGNEMMQRVNDVGNDLTTHKKLLKSITLNHSNTLNLEQELIILFSFAIHAIIGYIPEEIKENNTFSLEFHTKFGWTAGFSDSVRYRMLGNAVAVPVARWLGRRVTKVCTRQNPRSTVFS